MTGQGGAEHRSGQAGAAHATRLLILLCLLLFASTLTSLIIDLRGIEAKYLDLAEEMGRSFFQAINTMRGWNLERGGIYVQSGKDTQPNPYLPQTLRTVTTSDGKVLAMINHAQMTRLFSELLTQDRGIHIHISSLTPIRPDNYPDEWERHTLVHFQEGSTEEFDIVGKGDSSLCRYMAPLHMDRSCLTCHSGEQFSPAQVRGGISVSFSYAPFQKAVSSERKQNLLVHLLFFTLGIGLILVMGRKLTQNIHRLQDTVAHVKRLEGFLPICSQCKKVRLKGSDQNDPASWVAIEKYIQERTDAEFTHGLCPQCAKELYPKLFQNGAN